VPQLAVLSLHQMCDGSVKSCQGPKSPNLARLSSRRCAFPAYDG